MIEGFNLENLTKSLKNGPLDVLLRLIDAAHQISRSDSGDSPGKLESANHLKDIMLIDHWMKVAYKMQFHYDPFKIGSYSRMIDGGINCGHDYYGDPIGGQNTQKELYKTLTDLFVAFKDRIDPKDSGKNERLLLDFQTNTIPEIRQSLEYLSDEKIKNIMEWKIT